ncbi:MAG: flippase-like domain-containing protein [Chloroflexi bacterium]|nr:flippase-like domain-containing protein [Chloroflexota bacterium]
MQRRQRLIIGIIVSLLFLYLAMRKIDWQELWQAFRQADYIYLLPALALLLAINWVRAYRWRLLMYPDTHLPLPQVFRIVNIGYFFNNILPAKAGEIVRGYLVGRLISGGIGQALSTLLIERLLDVLTLVVLLVILIPLVELPTWAMRGGLLFGAGAIGGTIVLIILSRFGRRGVDWVWRLVGRLPVVGSPRFKAALQNLVDGFAVLTMRRLLPGIIVSSALIWLGYATFNYILMAAFHLQYLPFWGAALVLCATGFAMVVPSSPGAMGVFEWAGVQALAVYAVSSSVAFGYMLGLHAFTNLALILLGLIGLMREGISYSQIRRQAIEAAQPSEAETPDAQSALGS